MQLINIYILGIFMYFKHILCLVRWKEKEQEQEKEKEIETKQNKRTE